MELEPEYYESLKANFRIVCVCCWETVEEDEVGEEEAWCPWCGKRGLMSPEDALAEGYIELVGGGR